MSCDGQILAYAAARDQCVKARQRLDGKPGKGWWPAWWPLPHLHFAPSRPPVGRPGLRHIALAPTIGGRPELVALAPTIGHSQSNKFHILQVLLANESSDPGGVPSRICHCHQPGQSWSTGPILSPILLQPRQCRGFCCALDGGVYNTPILLRAAVVEPPGSF